MSYAGLQVPDGFEALHVVSAVAMASGYVIGRDYQVVGRPRSIVLLALLSAGCVTGYYIASNHIPAGIGATILLSVLAFGSFWPFSYILAIARNRAE
ncbi:hypothetical protein OM960_11075 [Defluviimonas sp. CAU 1641]|uniref:Uncharacterized protein n=2 Tax=Defluviimonas salinarum TaxID=2992147 RepID=A0ABT3J380_9RHOB|nr:hypothetical protein [Defluviimonas salinarum]